MPEAASDPYLLAPLDNIPGFSGLHYAHQVLYFPSPESDPSTIVQHVKTALAKTIAVLPLLGGTVKYIPHASQQGRMGITAPWRTVDDVITVKDLSTTDYPDYATLRSRHFPLSTIDYNRLMNLPKPGASDRPVMMVQITFIKQGMIWGIVFDHAYTDGTGAASVPRVWAAYCRGEDGSQFITPEIIDRSRLMIGSGTSKLEDFPAFFYNNSEITESQAIGKISWTNDTIAQIYGSLHGWILSGFRLLSYLIPKASNVTQTVRSESNTHVSSTLASPLTAEIFFFSDSKLFELKQMASLGSSATRSADWISTNDALASLLYCCITDAFKSGAYLNKYKEICEATSSAQRADWINKMAVQGSPTTQEPFSILGFVINARKFLKPPLPADYIGNVAIWDAIAAPFSALTSSPESVSMFAHHLRHRMKFCDENYIKGLIGVMDSVPDMSRIGLTPGPFAEFLVVVNSWAGFKWLDIDWGSVVGGKSERLRIEIVHIPGFCLVLPKIGEGARSDNEKGLEVIVTLTKDNMELMKTNQFFMRFAEWRCS